MSLTLERVIAYFYIYFEFYLMRLLLLFERLQQDNSGLD